MDRFLGFGLLAIIFASFALVLLLGVQVLAGKLNKRLLSLRASPDDVLGRLGAHVERARRDELRPLILLVCDNVDSLWLRRYLEAAARQQALSNLGYCFDVIDLSDAEQGLPFVAAVLGRSIERLPALIELGGQMEFLRSLDIDTITPSNTESYPDYPFVVWLEE